jgi:segregation and condensation protein A
VTFVVTTPSFSGPVQLLLQLISAHEMDVLDVALSPIVDEFVLQLRDETRSVDVNDLSEFLLIAAILLEMKSQSLLPGRDNTEPDEEFVGWEERDVLLARLLELRTYSSLADAFVSLLERASRAYPRLRGVDDGFVVTPPDLLSGVTTSLLAQAYLRGIEERPVPVVRLHHVTVDAVSVAARRGLRHPHRGHRPLPRAPGAVQARPRHARPGRDLRRGPDRVAEHAGRARPRTGGHL